MPCYDLVNTECNNVHHTHRWLKEACRHDVTLNFNLNPEWEKWEFVEAAEQRGRGEDKPCRLICIRWCS